MSTAEIYSVLFCGIGGQGVLKAADILGEAAMDAGWHVMKSEVHGMSQRGGSVESHLRFGSGVFSPLIACGKVDFLVPFDGAEARRLRQCLARRGIDLGVYIERALGEVSHKRFLNTWMLGVLSVFLPIDESVWLSALEKVLRYALKENRQAFVAGRWAAKQNGTRQGRRHGGT